LRVSGENTVGPEARSGWKTHWKRIVLFAVLFSILIVSLFYFVLPNILYPLRIDKIPAGAYIVPWMEPNPSIFSLSGIPLDLLPWNIDTVMTGALKLNITFTIPVPGQPRVVPSTVYLGHDAEYLYVGGIFSGIGPDPNSNAQDGYPDYFQILFDVADSGVLTFPEAGSTMSVDVSPPGAKPLPQGWASPLSWWYQDDVWRNYVPEINRGGWDFAGNVGMLALTVGNMAAEYDNSTGTLVILFSRLLSLASYYKNSLQMSPGERWVMGFVLELGLWNWAGVPYTDYVGDWPGPVYPYLSDNSSWWPKLVIDLTKQPATFPGQTGASGSPTISASTSTGETMAEIRLCTSPSECTQLTQPSPLKQATLSSGRFVGGIETHV
jgi:hypothetical protein